MTLTLTGPNKEACEIIGLLDTGADVSALPANDATRMGYTAELLDYTTISTADGPGLAFRAKERSSAIVPGAPPVPIELTPLVVPGADLALWGRTDVMGVFEILFDESEQTFTLTW